MRCCQFLHGKLEELNGAEDNLLCACSTPVSKTKRMASAAQKGKQTDTETNTPTRANTNGRETHVMTGCGANKDCASTYMDVTQGNLYPQINKASRTQLSKRNVGCLHTELCWHVGQSLGATRVVTCPHKATLTKGYEMNG